MLWEICTLIIFGYTITGLFSMLLSFYFIHVDKGSALKGHSNENAKIKIYIVIPLLREEARVTALFNVLNSILEKYDSVSTILITTEREYLEIKGTAVRSDTPKTIERILLKSKYNKRLFHFHYPGFNKVVAEQLNFGVNRLKDLIDHSEYDTTFCKSSAKVGLFG